MSQADWGTVPTLNSVAFTPDGQTLASTGYRTVRLWDSATGELLRSLERPDSITDVLADRSHDADDLRFHIVVLGAKPVIPVCAGRRVARAHRWRSRRFQPTIAGIRT